MIKEKLKSLGLCNSTIKTYEYHLNKFFNHIRKATNISEQEINDYLDYLIIVKNYSSRSRNLVAKIISCYCREILQKPVSLRMAKENKPIPKICEDHEFSQILSVTPNIKHRICLLLMRYSGLRRNEVIKVMKHNIQPDGRLLVKQGKGRKDRYTIIPFQVKELLTAYLVTLPADNLYVFQGQNSNHYNSMTPQKILVNAFKRLNWHKDRWFGCHALRHAFTIWALDNDIGDYDEVSKWLGHSVRQTTQIYTKCRRIEFHKAIKKCEMIGIIA